MASKAKTDSNGAKGAALSNAEGPSDSSDAEEWSASEQQHLEQLIAQYPEGGKLSGVARYVAILAGLKKVGAAEGKSISSIAMRVRWTAQRDSGRKRKEVEAAGKKAARPPRGDREPRPQSIFSVGVWPPPGQQGSPGGSLGPDSSNSGMSGGGMHGPGGGLPPPGAMGHGMPPGAGGTLQQIAQQCAAAIPSLEDHGSDSIGNLGGQIAQLLEQNQQTIGQVRSHWQACRVHEGGQQLCALRDNLLKVLNGMANMPGIMAQMPPLPVKLNLELASHIILAPPTTA